MRSHAFAGRGANLIVTGRRTQALEPLARQTGGRSITCGLANPDDVERLAREANGVDVFVANAALPATGLLEDLTQDEIDRMLDVNLRAPIALTRALTPAMKQRRRGHIVLISSP